MTPREIELTYKGRRKVVEEQWEMTRWSSYYSFIGSHINPKSEMKKGINAIKLPIDIVIEAREKSKQRDGKPVKLMKVKEYKRDG